MSDGHWQLEGNAAELYQRYFVPAITMKWAEDLIARAGLRVGDTVLDIGCAKGFLVHDLQTVVPGVVATGLDVSEYALQNAPGGLASRRAVERLRDRGAGPHRLRAAQRHRRLDAHRSPSTPRRAHRAAMPPRRLTCGLQEPAGQTSLSRAGRA